MKGSEKYGERKKTAYELKHSTLFANMAEAMLWHGDVWLQVELVTSVY